MFQVRSTRWVRHGEEASRTLCREESGVGPHKVSAMESKEMTHEVYVGAGYNLGWETALVTAASGVDVVIVQAFEKFYDNVVGARIFHRSLASRLVHWSEEKTKAMGDITWVEDLGYESLKRVLDDANEVWDFSQCLFPGYDKLPRGPTKFFIALIEGWHSIRAKGVLGSDLKVLDRDVARSNLLVAAPILADFDLCDQVVANEIFYPEERVVAINRLREANNLDAEVDRESFETFLVDIIGYGGFKFASGG